jgi:hypothetical protein
MDNRGVDLFENGMSQRRQGPFTSSMIPRMRDENTQANWRRA